MAYGYVSGHSVVAPLGDAATINGQVSSGEWTDAKEIRIGTDEWCGYVYVKHDDTYLYVLLDHVSDTVKNPMGWDNGLVAIDTTHNGGMEPDDNDLLFHSSGHWLLIGDTPYQYNDSQWAPLMAMGEEVNMTEQMEHMYNLTYGWLAAGQGSQGTSPNSETLHAIFEFRIPLAIVEGRDRFGFYIVMQDIDTPHIIDWPEVNGTDPDFWPAEPGVSGNLTSPMEWGTLILGTRRLPAVFHIDWNGYAFNVTIISNSTISDFNFSHSDMQISFNVTGLVGKAGYCNVSIPKKLLWGEFSVYKDGIPLEKGVNYTQTYNGTHYIFYITYTHTTHTIEIRGTEVIPEFPSAIILPLLMIATMVSVILRRRRRKT
ncbi:MAG: hypothetical protein ACE5J6_02795 [Candidatus Bathyarchaeia archaeon]